MRSYIQFITTPTADTQGTLLMLHFDTKRYLIGHVSEGTQRACIQRGIGLRKVSDIFLTGQTRWSNMGGLLGLILTLADSRESATGAAALIEAQKREQRRQRHPNETERSPDTVATQQAAVPLNLHSGANMNHAIATARRFIFRKGLPLRIKEYYPSDTTDEGSFAPTWTDENIRVHVISLLPGSKPLPEPRQARGISTKSNKMPHNLQGTEKQQHVPVAKGDEDMEKRRAVVSDMFDSNWRLDRLVETPLSQVQLPATIFVRDSSTKALEQYQGPLPGSGVEIPDITVLVRQPWPGAQVKSLPFTEPAMESVCYVVRNHPQRGRFLPKKAEELGIHGPMRALIAKGTAVKNDKGIWITPEMVLEPGKEGGGVVVADLPSIDYIASFLERPEWNKKEVMDGVGFFIWLLGEGVASDERLLQFQRERSEFQHIISSPENSPNILSLESAATAAIRHNMVDDRVFPIPKHDSPNSMQAESGSHTQTVDAVRGLIVGLEPRAELIENELVESLDAAEVASKVTPEVEPFKVQHKSSELDLSRQKQWQGIIGDSDAEIITLGTGSALPSKYRNVSANLLRVPGCGSYLLDCGENTLGTLKRLFSPDELDDVFRDLKMIWISHLHADHHLGTTSVIQAWYKAVHGGIPSKTGPAELTNDFTVDGPRLAVVSHYGMLNWLHEYSQVEDFGYSRLLPLACRHERASSGVIDEERMVLHVSTSEATGNIDFRNRSFLESRTQLAFDALNLKSLSAVFVSHCAGAQAVSFTCKNGLKFSYSGDCRPSYTEFARIGKNSHVLIHEATFEDDLKGDALAKKHSTISEALGVARAMKAKACVLTHFSQRYQKAHVVNQDQSSESTTTASTNGEHEKHSGDSSALKQTDKLDNDFICVMAYDYMRVKLNDLARLESLQPLLHQVYMNLAEKEASENGDSASQHQSRTSDRRQDEQPQSKKQKKGNTKREVPAVKTS